MTDITIFSDFLRELGVRHTPEFSNEKFYSMPFKSLFGISKLLDSYQIPNKGFRLDDKNEITGIATPFMAQTPKGFVIVTGIHGGTVSYLTQGVAEKIPLEEFIKAATGVVLCAFPDSKSCEPDFKTHRRDNIIYITKKWVLCATAFFLFLYLFISNGIYMHTSTVIVTLLDMAGLYMSYLLVQKSLNINSTAADNVCKVIQAGGCDSVYSPQKLRNFSEFSDGARLDSPISQSA